MGYLSDIIVGLVCDAAGAYGQGNYEVQVNGSDFVARGVTMV